MPKPQSVSCRNSSLTSESICVAQISPNSQPGQPGAGFINDAGAVERNRCNPVAVTGHSSLVTDTPDLRPDLTNHVLMNRQNVTQDEKYVFYLNPAKQRVWVRPGDPLPTFVQRDVHGEKHLQSFWVCAHGPLYWKLFTKSTTMDSKAMVNEIEEMDRTYSVAARQEGPPLR
ncbi:unnamed protein product [Heligmosomoides polygyrus]|uniref:FERM domain-containing protein n=1 Tax=Heligmosomoides polygyrus TaxID=6339 RepID=A0A183FIT0_HELPZ|nr:unnamed protein product [Heligmosomoides polygyrus]